MSFGDGISRKDFLVGTLMAAAAGAYGDLGAGLRVEGRGSKVDGDPILDLKPPQQGGNQGPLPDFTIQELKAAQKIAGLSFTDEQLQSILNAVRQTSRGFDSVRKLPISYQIEPPVTFHPVGRVPTGKGVSLKISPVRGLRNPLKDEDLAFLSVRELGSLIKSKQVSPLALTKIYLGRMKTYGDKLLCLVTLLEDRAMAAAQKAHDEIAAGKYRGPLHGIPCGIKDLFALKGYPTTWGSEPHKDQVFDYDSALVQKLDEAGAIIIAKLSLGALAQGDVWFKGRTKSPWNPAQGSSGSSAGSSSATAAGLVAFSIGTETLGSICSPSHQCRVTGLRPTYGRVSRRGAMAVSWTMDKVGPICRNAEDCAIVFSAIQGADPGDASSVSMPFNWRPDIDLSKLKIGFLIGANDDPKDLSPLEKVDYLKLLVSMGAKPTPVRFDPVPEGVGAVLGIESASAFDDFTRSDKIDLLKNSAWPNTYRSNRFVPAVEYLQAMRGRTMLMRRFEEQLGDLDLFVANGTGGGTLFITNLTGHPQVLVPFGLDDQNRNRSVSLVGRLYDEATILAVANKVQQAKGFHLLRPDLSKV